MAEFTEKQVYEALGLGAQSQEPAEPAAQTPEPEGAQVQEPAEPAQGQPQESSQAEPAAQAQVPEEPGDGAAGSTPEGKQPLSPEQRRENAARRRQQEQQARQAAIDQACPGCRKAGTGQARAFYDFFVFDLWDV